MLKELFKKMKAKASAIKTAVTGAMIGAMTMPVFASGITVKSDIDPLAVIGTIAGYLLSILQAVGLVFIVWGGFQFGMAMKDEDAASKSKAILVLVSGIVMVGLKAVLKGFGIIA